MAETRGVFSLSRVFSKKRNNNWVLLSDTYLQSPTVTSFNTGYFAGGRVGSSTRSLMEKLSYSDDTISPTPGISSPRYSHGSTGKVSVGYLAGGRTPAAVVTDTTEKISYSTDTTVAVPGAALSAARRELAGTGNQVFGYFGGGYDNTNPLSSVDKLTYSTDTTAEVPGLPFSPRNYLAATGNSTDGYFGGGFDGTNTLSSMNNLSYATDNMSLTPTAALSVASNRLAATGNSTDGYFGGGVPLQSTMNKLTYSTSNTSILPSTGALSFNYYALSATGNSTHGYFAGGVSGTGGNVSTIDKIAYSTDTCDPIPGVYVVARDGLAAVSSNSNALPTQEVFLSINLEGGASGPATGYYSGGALPSSILSNTFKISYATDVASEATTAPLIYGREYMGATGSSTAGYFAGGSVTTNNGTSFIEKLFYLSDTRIVIPNQLSSNRFGLAATGTSTHGYFAGGRTNPSSTTIYTTVDKMTFSTDTTTPLPSSGRLSYARHYLGATGNITDGYFYGGSDSMSGGSERSEINKLSYSSDTEQLLSTSASELSEMAASTSPTSAYFYGGLANIGLLNDILKLTYATDTVSSIPATIPYPARALDATGNSNSGYVIGGRQNFGPVTSELSKLNYETDTMSELQNIPNRMKHVAVSPRDHLKPDRPFPTPTDTSGAIV